ncbi:MAG: 5-formyltetrahydrofolate cyclo-ligase [Victivallales bacterium]|nr:5-formyltetrahydrofolate cyclo-ligase [Victivallales bacterium]
MQTIKKEIRKNILEERKKLALEQVKVKSRKIVDLIISSRPFKESRFITCYYPFRNEVDLLPLLEQTNKTLLFPKVVKGQKELDFYIAGSLNDFEAGVWGIMEPRKGLPKIPIPEIDLFLVPGVAFSGTGERVGYGGGYYDSTLIKRRRSCPALGVCFDIQIVEPGFSDEWDQKLDCLISESGTLRFT